jgi:hypothetical protein
MTAAVSGSTRHGNSIAGLPAQSTAARSLPSSWPSGGVKVADQLSQLLAPALSRISEFKNRFECVSLEYRALANRLSRVTGRLAGNDLGNSTPFGRLAVTHPDVRQTGLASEDPEPLARYEDLEILGAIVVAGPTGRQQSSGTIRPRG